jgi:uncharacterized protein (DUF4213/DUF364 family)
MARLILDRLLENLPLDRRVDRLYIGQNWTISIVQSLIGQRQAGLAATPSTGEVAGFQSGYNIPPTSDAASLASLTKSVNPIEAAVGLATLNALLQPDPTLIKNVDAADWLVSHGRGRKVALVGRFPFIEELRPVVASLWVLELAPQPGEYGADQAPQIIPQADVAAITSSTLVNHTLDGLLALARPETKVMLLGPSTPLTPLLFDFGVDLLSGVEIIDVEATLASVIQGVTFRRMEGVRRVTLEKL